LRIRLIQKPDRLSVDGMRLDRFQLGSVYEVGTSLGAFLLCEGWAEPAGDEARALMPATKVPPANVIGRDTAADFKRRKR
jgi:hypothetical protein